MEAAWLISLLIIGISLLVCQVLMFMNRKVDFRCMLRNPYWFAKSELYNERGNKFRKLYLAIYVVGIVVVISFFVVMSRSGG